MICASSGYGRGCEFGSGDAPLSSAHKEFVTGHTNNAMAKRSESFDIDLSPISLGHYPIGHRLNYGGQSLNRDIPGPRNTTSITMPREYNAQDKLLATDAIAETRRKRVEALWSHGCWGIPGFVEVRMCGTHPATTRRIKIRDLTTSQLINRYRRFWGDKYLALIK